MKKGEYDIKTNNTTTSTVIDNTKSKVDVEDQTKKLQKRISDLQSLYQYVQTNNNNNDDDNHKTQQHYPLSGRDIQIPLTSKAFFEGELQPNVSGEDNDEQVIVHVGKGIMVEMNRNEACQFLHQQMNQIQEQISSTSSSVSNNNNNNNSKTLVQQSSSMKLKKGFLNSTSQTKKKKKTKIIERVSPIPKELHYNPKIVSTNTSKYQSQAVMATTSTSTTTTTLPYMEIREEYDHHGNEIKAEALNVSNELIRLKRELKASTKEGQKEGIDKAHVNDVSGNNIIGKNDIVNTLLSNLPTNEDLNTPNSNKSNMSGYMNHHDSEIDTETESSNSLSMDMKYDAISSRLDALILLEEESEKKKIESIKSSKQLRSKTWAKGFLTSSATKKDSKKAIKANKDKQDEQRKEIHSVKEEKSDSVDLQVNASSKKVQFKNNNEVKEIPRIGMKSISSVNSSTNVIEHIQSHIGQPTPKRETVPIGGVVERYQNQIDNQQIDSTSKEEPKKLSRFAQRRQQLR